MSVYIKGMEMPEHCGYCRFRYDGICHVLRKTRYSPDECPLIPVPDHGRLIDADAEVEVWDVCGRQGVFPHFTTTVSKFLLGHLVGKIPPTIIPADKEGGE